MRTLALTFLVGCLASGAAQAATVVVSYEIPRFDFTFRWGQLTIRGETFSVSHPTWPSGQTPLTFSGILETFHLVASKYGGAGNGTYSTRSSLRLRSPVAIQLSGAGAFSNRSFTGFFSLEYFYRACQFTSGCDLSHVTRLVSAMPGEIYFGFRPEYPRHTSYGPYTYATVTFREPGGQPESVHWIPGQEVSRTVVPEPGTGLLLGVGLTSVGVAGRRLRRRAGGGWQRDPRQRPRKRP